MRLCVFINLILCVCGAHLKADGEEQKPTSTQMEVITVPVESAMASPYSLTHTLAFASAVNGRMEDGRHLKYTFVTTKLSSQHALQQVK